MLSPCPALGLPEDIWFTAVENRTPDLQLIQQGTQYLHAHGVYEREKLDVSFFWNCISAFVYLSLKTILFTAKPILYFLITSWITKADWNFNKHHKNEAYGGLLKPDVVDVLYPWELCSFPEFMLTITLTKTIAPYWLYLLENDSFGRAHTSNYLEGKDSFSVSKTF